MKIASLMSAAALFALAPVAHAQIDCAAAGDLIDFALDDFDEIAGEEIDDGEYEVDEWLDGAEGCSVAYDLDAAYSCFWVHEDSAAAAAAYDVMVADLSGCLTAWKKQVDEPEAVSGEFTPERAFTMFGEGSMDGLEWYVDLIRHDHSAGRDWHVFVTLSYF